jgi:quinol monooxygenase YgiN
MFVVIYRWKIKAGMDEAFRAAWRKATRAIVLRYGALGSRLHQAEDGDWLAYAQWPNRARWEAMRDGTPADAEAANAMRHCIDDSGEMMAPLCLTVMDDYLKPMKNPNP